MDWDYTNRRGSSHAWLTLNLLHDLRSCDNVVKLFGLICCFLKWAEPIIKPNRDRN